ncbi:DEKNAAC105548 [Brettanomyces naardenensis]|uniref:Probable transporter MCH1 n=1 Tax=Brettanomyces naardenensis TaxID=13370 RepID=A0A448YU02_BRENA|nr:DEKNAAC105548 [Brettanomyces naardenensis]
MLSHKLFSVQRILLRLYRKHGPFRLYAASFLLSVTACLSLGILTLFSIFAGPFQDQLGYSQATINRIIIFQMLGMNLCTPLSGYIADAKGIWILSAMAFVGYLAGFNLIFLIIKAKLDHTMMYLAFFIMGCSHASLIFSCLLNSAKSLGRYYRTLSISTPNMMVSFAGFLEIQIFNTFFHDSSNPSRSFFNILRFFWYTLACSTVISLMACRLTDTVEKFEEDSGHTEHEDFNSFDASPLLTGAGVVIHSPSGSILGSPRSWYVEDPSSVLNLDMELSTDSVSDIFDPQLSYRQKVSLFLKDPLMYPLLCCCFMSIGATEFFIANMSSILRDLFLKQLDSDLKVLSVTSTITRFLIMVLTDYCCVKFHVSRLTIFTATVILCGFGHLYLSSAPLAGINFHLVVVSNAILSSSVFTLVPAILASLYGLNILGTTWGIFASSSIVGQLFLNFLYSIDYGQNCMTVARDGLVICSTLTFFVSGCILLVLGITIMFLRKSYLVRADEFF